MSYSLPNASIEQVNIVESILNGNNIIVDSVAGSGKTTTVLHLAYELSKLAESQKILLLTYNSKLKLETAQKVKALGLNNIEVRSYHSFAVRHYDDQSYNDLQLINVVENLKSITLPKYDIIIVDEVQDMSDLYFKLICTIIRDHRICHNTNNVRFMIIGDIRQNIYQYKGADYKFLKYGHEIFYNLTDNKKWDCKQLSMSYRITNQIAEFINNVMLKEDKLHANKEGLKVQYSICNTFDTDLVIGNSPYSIVRMILDQTNNAYEDIFILAYSVKGEHTPIRILANKLSNLGHPIFIPGNDEEKLDETILKGKIAFSTFHQSKGLERKYVLVFSFDSSYYSYYARNFEEKDQKQCPNLLYVACTRAKEILYLLHHETNNFLPFIDKEQIDKYSKRTGQIISYSNPRNIVGQVLSVSKLTDYKNEMVINNALSCFSYIIDEKNDFEINAPLKIGFNYGEHNSDLIETVAEINGVALASCYELFTKNTCTILNQLKNMDNKFYGHEFSLEDMKRIKNSLQPIESKFPNVTLDEFTKLALIYCSVRSKFLYKLNQLSNTDWLTKDMYESVYKRMSRYLSTNCLFEVILMFEGYHGAIDIFDLEKGIMWEIKAVQSLKHEHLIQTVIYGYMLMGILHMRYNIFVKRKTMCDLSPELMAIYKCWSEKGSIQFKILNILDGQIISINFNSKKIREMLEILRLNESVTQNNFQQYYNQIVQTYTDINKAESKIVIHKPLKIKKPNIDDDFDLSDFENYEETIIEYTVEEDNKILNSQDDFFD